MSKPTPFAFKGKWAVDLRTYGFGPRYILEVPLAPPAGEVLAVHAAYEKLELLRRERGSAPQQGLALDAGPTIPELIRQVATSRTWATKGGEDWWRKTSAAVTRELRRFRALEFSPPAGNLLVLRYRHALRGLHATEPDQQTFAKRTENQVPVVGPKTANDRLSILGQVLAWAAQQGMIAASPIIPKTTEPGEHLRNPRFLWVDAATAKAVRERVFSGQARGGAALAVRHRLGRKPTELEVDDYIARRRLYLAFGFYTGLHRADLDGLVADSINVEASTFMRINTKSSRVIADLPVEMPGPLVEEIEKEHTRLGRPWHSEEAICGGPWRSVAAVTGAASKALGLKQRDGKPLNVCPQVLRTSFARQLKLRGYTKDQAAALMGHVDSKMLDTVYAQDVSVPAVRHKWAADFGTAVGAPGHGGRIPKLKAVS